MSARPIGFIGLMALVLVGCGGPLEEMLRVTSPDKRVDAVWMRDSGGGATVSFSYQLFIVPTGGTPIRGHDVSSRKTSAISRSRGESRSAWKSAMMRRESTASSTTGMIGILTTFDMSLKSDASHRSRPNCHSRGVGKQRSDKIGQPREIARS